MMKIYQKVSWGLFGSVVLTALLLSACNDSSSGLETAKTAARLSENGRAVRRWYSALQVKKGSDLYRVYCASCHGGMAEGAIDWLPRKGRGETVAPPLDGTGHAWKHDAEELKKVIHNPAHPGVTALNTHYFAGLNDKKTEAIISWFQSLWNDSVYLRWLNREETLNKDKKS